MWSLVEHPFRCTEVLCDIFILNQTRRTSGFDKHLASDYFLHTHSGVLRGVMWYIDLKYLSATSSETWHNRWPHLINNRSSKIIKIGSLICPYNRCDYMIKIPSWIWLTHRFGWQILSLTLQFLQYLSGP